jgi:hypothetical protein
METAALAIRDKARRAGFLFAGSPFKKPRNFVTNGASS